MSRHTEGPWIIRDMSDELHARFTVEKLDRGLRSVIAQADENWLCAEHGGAGVEANVRLLAAAPIFLKTLEEARAWVDLQGNYQGCRPAADAMINVIDTAIAAAVGEGE